MNGLLILIFNGLAIHQSEKASYNERFGVGKIPYTVPYTLPYTYYSSFYQAFTSFSVGMYRDLPIHLFAHTLLESWVKIP